MKPAKFDYLRPGSPEEAIEALGTYPDAKVLAGGQSLIPMMNMRLARPSTLVDIGRLDGLGGVEANGALHIGATAVQADVLDSAVVRRRWPLITSALEHVGHPATRARGTIGGSIAHGEPAAELPAVMLALDARFTVVGPRGSRSVGAGDFFLGHFTTVLADDELLVGLEVPDLPGSHWGFGEVVRRHGDYALAGAAVRLRPDRGSRIAEARVALFGVASTPVRASTAEERLVGTALGDRNAATEAARVALSGVDVVGDSFVSTTYRREAAAAVVMRALLEAATNPRGEA
jgi:carbon-monoxide dehydrogenase medium subunit